MSEHLFDLFRLELLADLAPEYAPLHGIPHTGRPPASLKPGSGRIPLCERHSTSKAPVKGRSGISHTGSPDGLPEACAELLPPHQRHHPSTVPRHTSDSASCVISRPSATGTVPEVRRLHSLAVARAALAHCVPSLAIGLGPVPPTTHIRSAPLQRQHTGNPHWPGLRPPQRGEKQYNTDFIICLRSFKKSSRLSSPRSHSQLQNLDNHHIVHLLMRTRSHVPNHKYRRNRMDHLQYKNQ